jgi:peptidoglycan/LPS O-acetylase OafA/YrhL
MDRNNSFGLIRLIAAICVVMGHAFPIAGQPSLLVLDGSLQGIAVKVFFVISGYLIFKSWVSDPSLFRFTCKRATRILPGLFGVVLVSVLIVGPCFTSLTLREYFSHPTTYGYLSNLYLYVTYHLPGVFSDNVYPHAINGSLWSLPVEVCLYVSVPVLFCFPRIRSAVCILAALAICLLNVQLLSWSWDYRPVFYGMDLLSVLDTAPYFFLGALLASFDHRFLPGPLACVVAACGLAVVQFGGWGSGWLAMICIPVMVIGMARIKCGRLSEWCDRTDMSYGIYLYGFPVQQAVSWFMGTGCSPWMNFGLSIGPILVLAYTSWVLIERPALRFKPSRPARAVATQHSIPSVPPPRFPSGSRRTEVRLKQ